VKNIPTISFLVRFKHLEISLGKLLSRLKLARLLKEGEKKFWDFFNSKSLFPFSLEKIKKNEEKKTHPTNSILARLPLKKDETYIEISTYLISLSILNSSLSSYVLSTNLADFNFSIHPFLWENFFWTMIPNFRHIYGLLGFEEFLAWFQRKYPVKLWNYTIFFLYFIYVKKSSRKIVKKKKSKFESTALE